MNRVEQKWDEAVKVIDADLKKLQKIADIQQRGLRPFASQRLGLCRRIEEKFPFHLVAKLEFLERVGHLRGEKARRIVECVPSRISQSRSWRFIAPLALSLFLMSYAYSRGWDEISIISAVAFPILLAIALVWETPSELRIPLDEFKTRKLALLANCDPSVMPFLEMELAHYEQAIKVRDTLDFVLG